MRHGRDKLRKRGTALTQLLGRHGRPRLRETRLIGGERDGELAHLPLGVSQQTGIIQWSGLHGADYTGRSPNDTAPVRGLRSLSCD